MHFSFHPKGEWSLLNEKATEVFGVNEVRNQVRVYSGCAEAILEAALGFFQQFPLKKKFFYFKNLDPHFDLAVTALSKMGLQARALEIADMTKPEAWQDQLDREAGVFLYSYDNPVTGALYPTADLDRILKEKSIFRITLSHASHLASYGADVGTPTAGTTGTGVDIDRSEIQVRQMPFNFAGNGIALSFVGERGRFGAITAEASTPCTIEDLVKLKAELEPLAQLATSWAAQIKAHEQKLMSDFKLYFSNDRLRTLDRLVFYFEDIDGHSFLSLLAETYKISSEKSTKPLQAAGCDSRFETASLTRWGGLKTMDWLKAHDLTPEMVRGLVVIYPEYFTKISADELKKQLLNVKTQILCLQNGET